MNKNKTSWYKKGYFPVGLAIGVLAVIAIVGAVFIQQQGKKASQSQQSVQKKILQTENNDKKTKSTQNEEKQQINFENKSSLFFDQTEKTVAVGEKFSLDVKIDPLGEKINAAQLYFVFDPKLVKVERITASSEFSLELMGTKIDNEKGTASIVLGVPLKNPSVEKLTTIATLNLQALSAGNGQLNFSEKTKAAAAGKSGDVLKIKTPISLIFK